MVKITNEPEKRITIKDIARIAKVSPSTVSMVLNDRPGIGEDTRYRVLRVIQALNFKPNLVARSLVKRQSNSVAMLITNTRNPIFPEIAGGVDEILKNYNYSLNIISTYDDEKLEAKAIETIRARGIDGLITSAAVLNGENLFPLVRSGFPVICVLRRIYNCDDLDYVIVDNVKGGYLAVEHLIRLGHRRIGIIKGPSNTSTGLERFEGAMCALRDYGLPVTEDLIYEGDYFKQTGYLATTKMIKGNSTVRPDAIFASNDDMAIGAFEAIWDVGLRIPEDIALVGFNNVESTSLRTIEITTISQRKSEMGRMAAKRLVDRIEKNRGHKKPFQVVLEPDLIIRKSCGYSNHSGYVSEKVERPCIQKTT